MKVESELDINELGKPKRARKYILRFLLIFIIGSGVCFFAAADDSNIDVDYKTSLVRTGDFKVEVAASGTLQPRNKVIVGCEISGTIDSIFKDYNDTVTKGELLATLRTDGLEARVLQLKAALDSDRASFHKAEVDLKDKQNESSRMVELRGKNAISDKKRDAAVTAKDMAVANLAQCEAQVRRAKANLLEAETNLKKAAITSPIDGLVLTRHVEAGQAVSSGMNTPQLYTLATNLQEMRLELNIDEADVGKIKSGQLASFTVDAYPNRKFSAHFIKLRYAPQRVQGVVTYVGIFAVNNADLLLRPGMTASAKIVVNEIKGKVIVPNSALRYSPAEISGSSFSGSDKGARVWVLRDEIPQAVSVVKGVSNGRFTCVEGGNLKTGDTIILSEAVPDADKEELFSF